MALLFLSFTEVVVPVVTADMAVFVSTRFDVTMAVVSVLPVLDDNISRDDSDDLGGMWTGDALPNGIAVTVVDGVIVGDE